MRKSPIRPTRAARAARAVVLGAIISVAGIGLLDQPWSYAHSVKGWTWTDRYDVRFVNAWTDDGPGAVDPGYDKDVAQCVAAIEGHGDSASVTLTNGYPSYTCRFWVKIKNVGTSKLRRLAPAITAPSELTVLEVGGLSTCGMLGPGKTQTVSFSVLVEQGARQGNRIPFTIDERFQKVTQESFGFCGGGH